jgi:hypothetical protein
VTYELDRENHQGLLCERPDADPKEATTRQSCRPSNHDDNNNDVGNGESLARHHQ